MQKNVASRNGCTNATGFIDFKIGNKATVSNFTSQICDGDFTNAETVNQHCQNNKYQNQ